MYMVFMKLSYTKIPADGVLCLRKLSPRSTVAGENVMQKLKTNFSKLYRQALESV
jgi:hypothetical protein